MHTHIPLGMWALPHISGYPPTHIHPHISGYQRPHIRGLMSEEASEATDISEDISEDIRGRSLGESLTPPPPPASQISSYLRISEALR
jgi:hypothetical protein